jgi:hemin uptake protein HemP
VGIKTMSSQQNGSGSGRGLGGAGPPSPGLPPGTDAGPPVDGDGIRYVRSADLFAGAREVVIQHEQHRYRLKITSRGGMILNK